MSRKIIIAAALVLGTAYSFACGGDDATKNTNTMPTSTATVTATDTATATATATATDTATAASTATAEPPKPKPLAERLGGRAGIEKVVDDFIANVKEDKVLTKYFTGTLKDKKKAETFRTNLTDFICKTAGGDCEYKGTDAKTRYAKMKIKDAEFDAVVADLTKALDKNGVGQTEKDEVLAAINAMRADVVTVAAKPGASASAKGADVSASAKASAGVAPKSSK
jgi:hemoglobin